MRTLQNVWDTFCNRFSNFPMQFNDEITPDGITTSWELTFYPLSDITANAPTVLKNTGTFASPTWVALTKWTDYNINFTTGQITFTIAPAAILDNEWENVPTINVVAYHVKINLQQFIQFWNEITGQMAIFWPVKHYTKVNGSDLGLAEGVSMSELDMTHAYWDQKNLLEIFQQETDGKHVLFERRSDKLLVGNDKNIPRRTMNWGPTDYNRTWSSVLRGTITLPFWISYTDKYPIFSSANPNDDLIKDTYLDIQDGWELNAVMRIGLSMYTMREHWSERINASTLRMSALKDIQMTKQGLSMEIMRHTGDNAPGRGNTPPTTFAN